MIKEDILQYLAQNTSRFCNKDDREIFTASYISDKFGVKRNTISHYLNQMIEEKKVIKINTRPVYFLHLQAFEKSFFPISSKVYESIEQLYAEKSAEREEDGFSELIGARGSLKRAIEQIKTSIFYPGNGLPIMLSGPTGVGKSLLAKLIYKFSVEKGIIDEGAPFVVFNCAQYFNNPELLSSNLFGYVKGAYTGAEKSQRGMLEEADGGILFLDEVHRLNAEGQEKLFTFMDQGVFRKMGESQGWHGAKVRLIFATTEALSEKFLGTFLRRIPIVVNIQGLDERGLNEKLQFIYYFLIKEAKTFNKKIIISKKAIDTILEYGFKGNVGELKNTVKYVCAAAYTKNLNGDSIKVKLLDIPENILQSAVQKSDLKIKQNDYITIEPEAALSELCNKEQTQFYIIENAYKQIISLYEDARRKKSSRELFETNVYEEIHALFDKLIFNNQNDNEGIMMQFITSSLQEVLRYMEVTYNVKFNGNSVYAMAYYLYYKNDRHLEWDKETKKIRDQLYEYVLKFNKTEHLFTTRFGKLIESKMDTSLTIDDEIFLSFYLKSQQIEKQGNGIKAVILAHGYATASSISNVVNRMLGTNVFEAFDMPIDIKVQEIIENLIQYIEKNDVSKGLIILFDTGSLKDIYYSIKKYINGPVAVVNNVSTQMAMFIGDMMMKKLYLEEIIESVKENNLTQYKIIYPEKEKQKVIVTSCFTGVGTALQIQKLLEDSIPEELGIKVLTHDYTRLKNNSTKEALFQLYEVLTIVGTANPEIEGINYISIEDLISGKGDSKLKRIFKDIADEDMIQKINNNIVRNFSLKRVIDSLTILDTDKIIIHIEECITSLEIIMNKKMPNDKKIALFVHVSCLIERLIRNTPMETYPDIEKFSQCQKTMIETIKKAFSVLEKIYNVNINLAEVGYIYDIITSKSLDNSEF